MYIYKKNTHIDTQMTTHAQSNVHINHYARHSNDILHVHEIIITIQQLHILNNIRLIKIN